MRRPAPRPLAAALEGLMPDLAPGTRLALVQQHWERAAGPVIAAQARPTGEREGVVTLTCSASVWAQELDLMADELISRLNASLGEDAVRGLRCRTA